MGLQPEGRAPGERRIDDLSREAFDRAVQAAAAVATQAVARVHRRRLVAQSATATFLACCLVGAIVTVVVKSAADAASRNNALSNCRLIRQLTYPLADFVASDARLRVRQQQLGQKGQVAVKFQHFFGATTYAKAVAESNRLNASTTDRWLHRDVPELRRVAGVDCLVRIP